MRKVRTETRSETVSVDSTAVPATRVSPYSSDCIWTRTEGHHPYPNPLKELSDSHLPRLLHLTRLVKEGSIAETRGETRNQNRLEEKGWEKRRR